MKSERVDMTLDCVDSTAYFLYDEDGNVHMGGIEIEHGYVTYKEIERLPNGPVKDFMEGLFKTVGSTIGLDLESIIQKREEEDRERARDWHTEQKINEDLERKHGW